MIYTKTENELWAITYNNEILWSRGGSSSSPKLMVYPSKKKAEQALNNSWTKQIIPDKNDVQIKMIYKK